MHKCTILVVGSVHADIVATYDSATANNRDKIGNIRISVGGAAYNVAANLAYDEHAVVFYTHVRSQSLLTPMVCSAIREAGIGDRFVREDPNAPESAFVAHSYAVKLGDPSELVSAVSCVGVEYCRLDPVMLRSAIAGCEAVVVDCNLSCDQILQVLECADRCTVPVLANAVSESKAGRLLEVKQKKQEASFSLVAMNTFEARHLGLPDNAQGPDYEKLRKSCGAVTLIVTYGENGYRVVEPNGSVRHFQTPTIPDVKNSLGAGDALLAAVAVHRARGKEIDWNSCNRDVQTFVNRVLRVEDATPQKASGHGSKNQSQWGCRAEVGAGVLFVCAIGLCVLGFFGQVRHPLVFGIMLFGVAIFAGSSGGLVRWMLDRQYESTTVTAVRATVFGLIAGFISALMFIIAQLLTNENVRMNETIPPKLNLLMLFALIISFAAGMTADAVLGRMATADPMKQVPNTTDTLTPR